MRVCCHPQILLLRQFINSQSSSLLADVFFLTDTNSYIKIYTLILTGLDFYHSFDLNCQMTSSGVQPSINGSELCFVLAPESGDTYRDMDEPMNYCHDKFRCLLAMRHCHHCYQTLAAVGTNKCSPSSSSICQVTLQLFRLLTQLNNQHQLRPSESLNKEVETVTESDILRASMIQLTYA